MAVLFAASFVVPFVDPRRPLRLFHVDLAALLAFGASHVFFNRGELAISVPLAYAALAYVLARMLPSASDPHVPIIGPDTRGDVYPPFVSPDDLDAAYAAAIVFEPRHGKRASKGT